MKILKDKGQSWQDVAHALADAAESGGHLQSPTNDPSVRVTVEALCTELQMQSDARVSLNALTNVLRKHGIEVFWPTETPLIMWAGGRTIEEVQNAAGFWWAHEAMEQAKKMLAPPASR